MANNKLCADKEIIKQFINEITKDWYQFSDRAGKFEIRCLGENRTPITQIFTLEAVAEAVDFAIQMNTTKLNVYMTINPRLQNTGATLDHWTLFRDFCRKRFFN
tara:strand:+ start:195 stop:506 length:312 start_codon:yes stop_codon:yes gene_type:complete